MIYLIGSLRNEYIPRLADQLREDGYDVFDDWHCPGPQADEYWHDYEVFRGRKFTEALAGKHAWNVFNYDKGNLDASSTAVLVCPAGKSAHLELGYCVGRGIRTAILLDKEPERFDIMYRFADTVCNDYGELRSWLGYSECPF